MGSGIVACVSDATAAADITYYAFAGDARIILNVAQPVERPFRADVEEGEIVGRLARLPLIIGQRHIGWWTYRRRVPDRTIVQVQAHHQFAEVVSAHAAARAIVWLRLVVVGLRI